MRTIQIPLYLFISLFLAIILISTIFYFAMQDGDECISNPMVYGAKKAVETSNSPIQCSCDFYSPDYAPFYFNDEKISLESGMIE